MGDMTFNIHRGAKRYEGKSIEQVDSFCENASSVLSAYAAKQGWDVTINTDYGNSNISVGEQQKTSHDILQGLLDYVEQFPEAFDSKLDVPQVLQTFDDQSA